ncbi:MAG: hypothetical protein ACM3RX_08810, partial [Methanococcaceae archaeon]
MKKFINSDEAAELITQLGVEFAVIRNPEGDYPPFEICPLMPKINYAQKKVSAVVLNLEGVAASLRDLSFHSLEFMIRQVSGRLEKEQWYGLDKIIDYPNLIGFSSTRQIEYLVQRYHNFIKAEYFKEAYLNAVLWTLILGKEEHRKREVKSNLLILGLEEMLADPKLEESIEKKEFGKYNANVLTNYFVHKYGDRLNLLDFYATARAAADIYLKRY